MKTKKQNDVNITKWEELNKLSREGQNIWEALLESNKVLSFDYLRKLLIFELDSALHLKNWQDIRGIIQKVIKWDDNYNNALALKTREGKMNTNKEEEVLILPYAVDLLLNAKECPIDILLESLRLITSESLGKVEKIDDISGKREEVRQTESTIKWVRVFVGLTLPQREEICIDVLAQLKEVLLSKGKVS